MASQNSPATQLEPIPTVKIRKSRKAPAIKTAVILSRANGKAKSHIARDLGITHNTVNAILEESDIERQLESGQVLSAQLIPDAIRVAKHRLSQNSENMAIKVLENTIWPLNQKAAKPHDVGLTLAIQNLMGNVNVQQVQEKSVEPQPNKQLSDSGSGTEVQGK